MVVVASLISPLTAISFKPVLAVEVAVVVALRALLFKRSRIVVVLLVVVVASDGSVGGKTESGDVEEPESGWLITKSPAEAWERLV